MEYVVYHINEILRLSRPVHDSEVGVLPPGYITDEKQSVLWNRQVIEESKKDAETKRGKELERRQKKINWHVNEICKEIRHQLDCNKKQAQHIYLAALDEGQGFGSETIADAIDKYMAFAQTYEELE